MATRKSKKGDSPAAPSLSRARERIDGIDRQIQALIAERAGWAQSVGKAKGPLKAAIDYYRPEREAQVLRQVLDRNDGPLADEVLLRLFREMRRGVVLRPMIGYGLPTCLRISVGTRQENLRLVKSLDEVQA